jgi:ligand-binding sensor domain-containing protein/serine phosphatase RsbU (regulator of sigma subunit)
MVRFRQHFHYLKSLLVFLFLIVIVAELKSQRLNFRSYQVEDGLPQSTIYDIFQDRDGYIWLGTEGAGLCRFDGYRFSTYGRSSGLAGNVVRRITADAAGRLWVATNNGLYFMEGDSLHLLDQIKDNQDIFFMSVYCDSRNNIWATSSGKGVFRISGTYPDFKIMSFGGDEGLHSNFVFDVCEDKEGNLWFASFGYGLDQLFPDGKIEGHELSGSQTEVISLLGRKNGDIVVGTKSEGAWHFDPKKNKFATQVEGTEGSQVWSMLEDSSGLWTATDKNGISCSDHRKDILPGNGLPQAAILRIMHDRERNLWIGTNAGGLFRFSGRRFVHLSATELPGLLNVSAVFSPAPDETWLGTENGIYSVKMKDGRLVKGARLTAGIASALNDVTSFCRGKDGIVYIGTRNGLFTYNGQFRLYSADADLAKANVSSLLFDRKERLWVGTSGGLLMIENGAVNSLSDVNGLVHNEVQCLVEDREGAIWIATYGGLMKFEGDQLQNYTETDGLTEKKVYCVAVDNRDNVLIGTFGSGILRFDKKAKKISPFCPSGTLLSLNITCLIFDGERNLFAGTTRGLHKLRTDENGNFVSGRYFGKENGFANPEVSPNAAYHDKEGRIWFGTSRGVSLYSPQDDQINSVKPNLRITDFKVNGNARALQGNGIMNLGYKENDLYFAFTGISHTDPSANLYFARLQGYDSSWTRVQIDPGDRENFASVAYHHLPEGKYVFTVRAVNNDGIVSESASLHFQIHQPYYKTWWFILAIVLCAILLGYSYTRFREKNLVKAKEKLERTVDERTAELRASKEEVEKQKSVVEFQKQEITDSINYSRRIQNAILPDQGKLSKRFPESFILYRPKDIVSGDFYFFSDFSGGFIVAVADCTGHGVPGAFMSLIGSRDLHDAANKAGDTSELLSLLNRNMRRTLQQSHPELGIRDGMDIAVVHIPSKANGGVQVSYSGANRPLWVIRNGSQEVQEFKATKNAIGGHTQDDQHFAKEQVNLQQGDMIFLFSDGYADQFGGPVSNGNSGKKMMTKKFRDILLRNSHKNMSDIREELNLFFDEWKGGHEQVDDVLVIGWRI